MKKLFLIIVLLATFPLFAQSMFSGGSGGYAIPTPTTITTEVVYKKTVVEGQLVNFAISKTIEKNSVSYNVRFFLADDTFEYGKDYIQIDDFDLFEGSSFYSVVVYYSNYKVHYETKQDSWGDDYQLPVYDSTEGTVAFDVKKYGIK